MLDLDALNKAERRELGLARRRLPEAGLHALPGRAVARRRRRRRDPRVRPRRRRPWSRTASSAPRPRAGWAGSTRTRVYVGTDFGPGTMTSSGYPRIVKEWKRGTPLGAATHGLRRQARRHVHRRAAATTRRASSATSSAARIAFYNDELYLRGKDGKLAKIDAPNSARQVGAQASG